MGSWEYFEQQSSEQARSPKQPQRPPSWGFWLLAALLLVLLLLVGATEHGLWLVAGLGGSWPFICRLRQ